MAGETFPIHPTFTFYDEKGKPLNLTSPILHRYLFEQYEKTGGIDNILNDTLTSISALGSASNKGIYTTGVSTWAEFSLTSFALSILDDTDEATFKQTVNLEIGTDVQAFNANLQSISSLGTAADKFAYTTDVNVWAEADITAFARSILDDADEATFKATVNLEIGADVQAYSATLDNTTSGTYTPSLTNTANLDASTAYECQYIRVGSVITVSGKVDMDPTAGATLTQIGISLPVASNLAAEQDCCGTACSKVGDVAAIYADSTNDVAMLEYVSSGTANKSFYFTFTYAVI